MDDIAIPELEVEATRANSQSIKGWLVDEQRPKEKERGGGTKSITRFVVSSPDVAFTAGEELRINNQRYEVERTFTNLTHTDVDLRKVSNG